MLTTRLTSPETKNVFSCTCAPSNAFTTRTAKTLPVPCANYETTVNHKANFSSLRPDLLPDFGFRGLGATGVAVTNVSALSTVAIFRVNMSEHSNPPSKKLKRKQLIQITFMAN